MKIFLKGSHSPSIKRKAEHDGYIVRYAC